MGIFDRLASLIKSNVNDMISSAENPEKMLNQIIVDMRDQLVKAKQQVAAAIADEKRLHDQFEAEYKQSQDWEQKAMLAIKEGRDDLAKQALVRQSEHYAHAQQLEVGGHEVAHGGLGSGHGQLLSGWRRAYSILMPVTRMMRS